MRPQYRGFLALAAAVLLAMPAAAEESAAGRYLLTASSGGFIRLDTATGATSHCRQKQDGVWRCEPLLVDNAATDARIAALSSDVARLSAALVALDARVAALAHAGEKRIVSPAAEAPAVDRDQSVAQRLVQRFLEFVRTLKHGREGSA